MLHAASTDPATLAIGVDADASSMGGAARRAERPKTALPNALFVVAAAEALPRELDGVADLVTVLFPWSSLLRGLLTGDGPVLRNVASVCRQDGQLVAMWSLVARDGSRRHLVSDDDDVGAAFERCGLRVVDHRVATQEEIDGTRSSWAKRLRAGVERPVTRVHAVRI